MRISRQASFRPQQGLTIMNQCDLTDLLQHNSKKWFPSPTGVNYYELFQRHTQRDIYKEFPSPTGVNYYESDDEIFYNDEDFFSFRPQQGLTIMNHTYKCMIKVSKVSVPNRG